MPKGRKRELPEDTRYHVHDITEMLNGGIRAECKCGVWQDFTPRLINRYSNGRITGKLESVSDVRERAVDFLWQHSGARQEYRERRRIRIKKGEAANA